MYPSFDGPNPRPRLLFGLLPWNSPVARPPLPLGKCVLGTVSRGCGDGGMVPLAPRSCSLSVAVGKGRAGHPGVLGPPQVWQCGGSMEVLPCSRVAHIERTKKPYNNDIDYYAKRNALRAAEVWMDGFKSHVYMAWNIPMTVSRPGQAGRRRRRGSQGWRGQHLGDRLRCCPRAQPIPMMWGPLDSLAGRGSEPDVR